MVMGTHSVVKYVVHAAVLGYYGSASAKFSNIPSVGKIVKLVVV